MFFSLAKLSKLTVYVYDRFLNCLCFIKEAQCVFSFSLSRWIEIILIMLWIVQSAALECFEPKIFLRVKATRAADLTWRVQVVIHCSDSKNICQHYRVCVNSRISAVFKLASVATMTSTHRGLIVWLDTSVNTAGKHISSVAIAVRLHVSLWDPVHGGNSNRAIKYAPH